jgi:hypothetical protein
VLDDDQEAPFDSQVIGCLDVFADNPSRTPAEL